MANFLIRICCFEYSGILEAYSRGEGMIFSMRTVLWVLKKMYKANFLIYLDFLYWEWEYEHSIEHLPSITPESPPLFKIPISAPAGGITHITFPFRTYFLAPSFSFIYIFFVRYVLWSSIKVLILVYIQFYRYLYIFIIKFFFL